MGQTGERIFGWFAQVRDCFAKADTGERMFCWSRRVMFRKIINMTPLTVAGGSGIGLSYSALLATEDTLALVCLAWLHREWLGKELLLIFQQLLPIPWTRASWGSLVVSSGSNYSFADSWVVTAKWTELLLLIHVGILLEDWTTDKGDRDSPKELVLNRSTTPVCY